MNRLFKLATIKAAVGDSEESLRAKNLHRRLCELESEVRRLTRKGTS
jgi:hypothetical protein